MQPNKSVEETIESIMTSEPMKRVLGIESTAIISGRATQYEGKLLQDVLREALTSHTNTVLQGVVERVEKQQKEWSIISEKADTIFMTGKPTEDYSLEQAHHDAGYYGNKAEALDVAVSLLNDQIISNEEKK